MVSGVTMSAARPLRGWPTTAGSMRSRGTVRHEVAEERRYRPSDVARSISTRFREVCINQIGPEREGLLPVYDRKLRPKWGASPSRRHRFPGPL